MSTLRGSHIVSSWIALLAILMVTFVPTVTGAMPASTALPWDKICSAANAATDKRGAPDSPATVHAFEHCPYCALHTDPAPPPDARLADAGRDFAFRALPVAFARAPRGNAAWASAQPRAPPRFA